MPILLWLLLISAAWAQGPVLEFPCEPVDALVYRQVENEEPVLLGPVNRPLKVNRTTLPAQMTLIYRRPGWQEARVLVDRKQLQGARYPAAGRSLCLTPGISLVDRGHQFAYAASSCFIWLGFIVVLTTLVGIGQRAMNRRNNAPRSLGATAAR